MRLQIFLPGIKNDGKFWKLLESQKNQNEKPYTFFEKTLNKLLLIVKNLNNFGNN